MPPRGSTARASSPHTTGPWWSPARFSWLLRSIDSVVVVTTRSELTSRAERRRRRGGRLAAGFFAVAVLAQGRGTAGVRSRDRSRGRSPLLRSTDADDRGRRQRDDRVEGQPPRNRPHHGRAGEAAHHRRRRVAPDHPRAAARCRLLRPRPGRRDRPAHRREHLRPRSRDAARRRQGAKVSRRSLYDDRRLLHDVPDGGRRGRRLVARGSRGGRGGGWLWRAPTRNLSRQRCSRTLLSVPPIPGNRSTSVGPSLAGGRGIEPARIHLPAADLLGGGQAPRRHVHRRHRDRGAHRDVGPLSIRARPEHVRAHRGRVLQREDSRERGR